MTEAAGRDATRADATPERWRQAALAMLLGGMGAGYVGSRNRAVERAIAAGFRLALLSAVPIAIASRRAPIEPADATASSHRRDVTFSVVVAARDEASVLPNLIADIAEQDHRSGAGDRPLFELIVIDDRSTDGTPQAVLRAAASSGIGAVTRLVRRSGTELADGKGAALTAVPPEVCRGDVVVVLDADARVGPTFLSTLAGYISLGIDAATVRRRVLGADASQLAGAQADEQLADGEIQRGRWALGGCSEFRGNGIVVRRDLLARVGGWRDALTEDLDLSSRIAAAEGIRVAWLIDVDVWEEPVRDPAALWRQRVRWAEGGLRRLFEHGPAVMRSDRLSVAARADFASYAAQLVAPSVVIGALVGAVVHRRPRLARRLVATYAATAAAIGFDSLRWERDANDVPLRIEERARRAVRLAAFGSIWIGAVPAALWRIATRRGVVAYDKMPHSGAGESAAPRSSIGSLPPARHATSARDGANARAADNAGDAAIAGPIH